MSIELESEFDKQNQLDENLIFFFVQKNIFLIRLKKPPKNNTIDCVLTLLFHHQQMRYSCDRFYSCWQTVGVLMMSFIVDCSKFKCDEFHRIRNWLSLALVSLWFWWLYVQYSNVDVDRLVPNFIVVFFFKKKSDKYMQFTQYNK